MKCKSSSKGKQRKDQPAVGFGWHSPSMARVMGGERLYQTPEGTTIAVTLVDTWRGGRRLARWRDMKYVGRILMDSFQEIRPLSATWCVVAEHI